jgi:hypothetical protein
MAINPTIQVTGKSGTVKKINASKVFGDMGSDAVWYSIDAAVISSVPTTLSNANKEWIVWERGQYVQIKFTGDSGADDGQGFVAAQGAAWTVDAVSGTVYVVRRKYLSMADTLVDAFSNSNRQAAAASDVLYPGDVIVCTAKGSYFQVKLNVPSDTPAQYVAMAIDQMGITAA